MTSIVKFDESYFVYPGNNEVWAVYHVETWSRYYVVSSLPGPRSCVLLEMRLLYKKLLTSNHECSFALFTVDGGSC